jgi:DNA-binding IclR family transcriptional regulator
MATTDMTEVAGRAAPTGQIQVIARAGEILRHLAKTERGATLKGLAEATGLPRSTVHRIVVALAGEHLVVWDPERGVAELSLGLVSLALSHRQRLRDCVRPFLEMLVSRVDETVDLVVLQGENVVFVDQVMAHQLLVVSAIGAVLPVHCTACGKALLAELPREEAERLLPAKLKAFTPYTITDREVLFDELSHVRETRLAFDHDEQTDGISAVGAVIRNAWGEAAAVTIPLPTMRLKGREQELGRALLDTCDELNAALGCGRPDPSLKRRGAR